MTRNHQPPESRGSDVPPDPGGVVVPADRAPAEDPAGRPSAGRLVREHIETSA
jgi:hypothetical protein